VASTRVPIIAKPGAQRSRMPHAAEGGSVGSTARTSASHWSTAIGAHSALRSNP